MELNFKPFGKQVNVNIYDLEARPDLRLMTTKVTGDELWELYLASFPEGSNPIYKKKTEHDCNCCRSFVRHLGGVVAVDQQGRRYTFWDGVVEPGYAEVANALREKLLSAELDLPYFSEQKGYGKEYTYDGHDTVGYNHFYGHVPQRAHSLTPDKLRGNLRTAKQTLERALSEFKMEAVNTVLGLINDENLVRGEQYKMSLISLKKTMEAYQVAPDKQAFLWNMAGVNSNVDTIRGQAIGTLLVGLSKGEELEAALGLYEFATAGPNYKRSKTLVTPKMIERAKAAIEELGLSAALDRRVATFDDLPHGVTYFRSRPKLATAMDGVFGQIKTKDVDGTQGRPTTKDEFFQKLALADEAELYMTGGLSRRMATILTAAQKDAPPLFKWDNAFSWSYTGDVTDAIRERVKDAGGRVDAPICFRLAWHNYDDLDLHLVEPLGDHIHYGVKGKKLSSSGMLDVDANGGTPRGTRTPVENITYDNIRAMPNGTYEVFVEQFCVNESKDPGFIFEAEVLGEKTVINYPNPVPYKGRINLGTLKKEHTGEVKFFPALTSQTSSSEIWGVFTNRFIPINAVFHSPNYWGENAIGHRHTFVTLEGCVNPEDVRGFYNEFLRSDLDEHRKVMEHVGMNVRAAATNERQLSGVGFIQGIEATFKLWTKGRPELLHVRF